MLQKAGIEAAHTLALVLVCSLQYLQDGSLRSHPPSSQEEETIFTQLLTSPLLQNKQN